MPIVERILAHFVVKKVSQCNKYFLKINFLALIAVEKCILYVRNIKILKFIMYFFIILVMCLSRMLLETSKLINVAIIFIFFLPPLSSCLDCCSDFVCACSVFAVFLCLIVLRILTVNTTGSEPAVLRWSIYH